MAFSRVVLAWALIGQVSLAAADDRCWTKLATHGTGPSERSRPAVAAVGAEIYVFGGGFDEFASGEFEFYDELFMLDPASGRWRELPVRGERPDPRAFTGHAALDDARGFVVFGGGVFTSDQAVTLFGDLWLYSRADRRFVRLSDDSAGPGKRFDPKVWFHGGVVYVFGGMIETYEVMNDLWAFSLRTREWSVVTQLGDPASPAPRGVVRGPDRAIDGRLYFYGGEGGPDTGFQIFDDTWAFDLEARQWIDVTPAAPYQLDPPRNHNSVARIGRALYAYGGDISGGPQSCGAPFPQNPVDELWRYDTRRARWSRVDHVQGDLPPPLKRHEAVTVGGAMYLIAGYDFAAAGGGEACQVWNLDVFEYR